MRPFLKITPEGLTKVSIPKQYMGRQKKLKCMFFKYLLAIYLILQISPNACNGCESYHGHLNADFYFPQCSTGRPAMAERSCVLQLLFY